AAEAEIEIAPEDRLAGTRECIRERDQIGVGTAYDGNSRCLRHLRSSLFFNSRRRLKTFITDRALPWHGVFSPLQRAAHWSKFSGVLVYRFSNSMQRAAPSAGAAYVTNKQRARA